MRAGLELWAARRGATLLIEDDRSTPERAARLHDALTAAGCRFVIGPYGSDSTRACAAGNRSGIIWNHGAAADDVQRMPGVVSVASPASRYLVALGAAMARLRPGARIALAAGRGRFARFAVEGLERNAGWLGLELVGRFPLSGPPRRIVAARPEALIACGQLEREVALFRSRDDRHRAARPQAGACRNRTSSRRTSLRTSSAVARARAGRRRRTSSRKRTRLLRHCGSWARERAATGGLPRMALAATIRLARNRWERPGTGPPVGGRRVRRRREAETAFT